MKRLKTLSALSAGVFFCLASCIEPFDATTEEFESVLVVDAFISNELRDQQVLLSRAFRFEQDSAQAERNARVKVVDDMQRERNFIEVTPGKYVSEAPFKAELGRTYTLSIQTSEGRSYSSRPAQLRNEIEIDSLYAERIVDDLGEEGMAIFIDSFDPSGESRFYRYEYEETFIIIAPRWTPVKWFIVPDSYGQDSLILAPRDIEERLCYGTNPSRNIIIESTSDLSDDRLQRFMVRFVNRNNYILSHRYSILVKQFVISREAHAFNETLNDLSSLESLFSENQPGFFEGNVFSEDSRNEKVLGFFEISSVDEKRIFFDYEDYFPGERLPPWAIPCRGSKSESVMEQVRINLVRPNDPAAWNEPLIFNVINRTCGDCTVLGSNVRPDFWVD